MATQLGKQVVDAIRAAGLHLVLATDLTLKVSPASTLTPELRILIRVNKTALINSLRQEAANDVTDPDRWCWPHSPAMNTVEFERFMARLVRFADLGVIPGDSHSLADRLVTRDRVLDDRVLCLECTHLKSGGRCGNWQRAGVAVISGDAQLAKDFTHQLQWCDGFKVA